MSRRRGAAASLQIVSPTTRPRSQLTNGFFTIRVNSQFHIAAIVVPLPPDGWDQMAKPVARVRQYAYRGVRRCRATVSQLRLVSQVARHDCVATTSPKGVWEH
jgi:hypothetical protein